MPHLARHAFAAAMTPRPGEIHAHTALRGIACLGVVGYHAVLLSGPDASNPVGEAFRHMFLFVDMFFMLSGFIMLETYGRYFEQGVSWKSAETYWRRRVLKIMPNYYFWLLAAIVTTMALTALTGRANPAEACFGTSVLKHIFLIQNLAGTCFLWNTPLWSITTEMIAYIAFPVLVAWLFRSTPAVFLAIATALYAVLYFLFGTFDLINGGVSVLRTFAGFAAGMALAQIAGRAARANPRWYVTHALVQLGLVGVMLGALASGAEPVAILVFTLLVYVTAADQGLLGRLSRQSWLYVPGRASFAIYLAHTPVKAVLTIVCYKLQAVTGLPFVENWIIFLMLNCALSCGVGVVGYVWIERWFEHKFRTPRPKHVVQES